MNKEGRAVIPNPVKMQCCFCPYLFEGECRYEESAERYSDYCLSVGVNEAEGEGIVAATRKAVSKIGGPLLTARCVIVIFELIESVTQEEIFKSLEEIRRLMRRGSGFIYHLMYSEHNGHSAVSVIGFE